MFFLGFFKIPSSLKRVNFSGFFDNNDFKRGGDNDMEVWRWIEVDRRVDREGKRGGDSKIELKNTKIDLKSPKLTEIDHKSPKLNEIEQIITKI